MQICSSTPRMAAALCLRSRRWATPSTAKLSSIPRMRSTFSQGFPPSLFVSNTDSLAEHLQRELPEVRLVKMFNTMANEVMINPRGLGEDSTVFVAGNDEPHGRPRRHSPPNWAGLTCST